MKKGPFTIERRLIAKAKELLKLSNKSRKMTNVAPIVFDGKNWKKYITKVYGERHKKGLWMLDKFQRDIFKGKEYHPVKKTIEILHPVEGKLMRTYTLLSPHFMDTIIEFKVDLTPTQIKDLKNPGGRYHYTQINPMTNEKSRWVVDGTSLPFQHPPNLRRRIAARWSENAYAEGIRVLSSYMHKRKGLE